MKGLKTTAAAAVTMLVVIFALVNTSAYDKKGRFVAFGPGNEPCREFDQLRDRKLSDLSSEQQELIEDAVQYWMSGFYTAWNYFAGDTYDILGRTKFADVVAQLERFCERNPDKKLVQAAIIVGHALQPTSLKEPRSKTN